MRDEEVSSGTEGHQFFCFELKVGGERGHANDQYFVFSQYLNNLQVAMLKI